MLSLSQWHSRLGHSNFITIRQALQQANIPFSVNKNHDPYHACSVSKSHKLPFELSTYKATGPLDLICYDLWGPFTITSIDGKCYYVLFFDHFSKYCWIYFVKYKSKVLSVFIKFRHLIEKYFGRPIKSFQADWGDEFQALTSYLLENGITQRSSYPKTLE